MEEHYRKMEIQEIVDIYLRVKKNTIEALSLKGLSLNEIVRRLGGASKPIIKKILEEIKKGK